MGASKKNVSGHSDFMHFFHMYKYLYIFLKQEILKWKEKKKILNEECLENIVKNSLFNGYPCNTS